MTNREALLDQLANVCDDDPVRAVVDGFMAGATIADLCENYDFHRLLVEGIIRLALR